MNGRTAASLYMHVPFCAGACDYCDFYSVATVAADERLDAYVFRILQDIRSVIAAENVEIVPSVYIGGGTPSVLGARRFERLLIGLQELLPEFPGECTVEANPESATDDFLAVSRDLGVSRLSLGIQSLDPACRRAVGRLGDAMSAQLAAQRVYRYFGGDFSIDIISGLPQQDEASLMRDLAFASSCGANHVSLYSLTIETGTRLSERVASGAIALPTASQSDELWLMGRDFLESEGFLQYEVSNFARAGAVCRHNIRYWRLENYLGCGPGAVGTIIDEASATAVRRAEPADVDAWLACSSLGRGTLEKIGRKELLQETMLMGFRTIVGLDPALFRSRFKTDPESLIGRTLDVWKGTGLAIFERPALNRAGLLLLDRFLLDCFRELDTTYPKYEESLR